MDLCSVSTIKQILNRHGFKFSKSMGQNFLTASWVPERIADEARLNGDVGVLEIGPGIGCLTVQLAKRARKVVAVELDSALRPVLAETLGGCDNTEVVFADVLKCDIPALMAEKFGALPVNVCANLPYNITTPVLTAVIESKCYQYITVMVQREVARRICASAGGADYGAFTVFCNWHTSPEILFDVSPGCFIPQPKVTSSVVRFEARRPPAAEVDSEEMFFHVVRAAFNQRRKTLVNALYGAMPGLTKGQIETAVISCGLDARIRGEALGIAQFAELSNALGRL